MKIYELNKMKKQDQAINNNSFVPSFNPAEAPSIQASFHQEPSGPL